MGRMRRRSNYNDVIMGAMASQITSLTIVDFNCLFTRRYKKTSKLHVTGLCVGRWSVNSPHKWSIARKLFPFDDVIMQYGTPRLVFQIEDIIFCTNVGLNILLNIVICVIIAVIFLFANISRIFEFCALTIIISDLMAAIFLVSFSNLARTFIVPRSRMGSIMLALPHYVYTLWTIKGVDRFWHSCAHFSQIKPLKLGTRVGLNMLLGVSPGFRHNLDKFFTIFFVGCFKNVVSTCNG